MDITDTINDYYYNMYYSKSKNWEEEYNAREEEADMDYRDLEEE